MIIRILTLIMLTTIGVVGSSSSAYERKVPVVRIDSPKYLDLDKSWTTGGQEKNNGSQVITSKALASRVSLPAERTGFRIRQVLSY